MLCCPGSPRQHCTAKNLVQCCLNTPGRKLHGQKLCAILSERLQRALHRKTILFKVILIHLGQHFTVKNFVLCCPRGSRQYSTGKDPLQCRFNTLGTTLPRQKSCSMLSSYSWDNLVQVKNLCNFVQEAPEILHKLKSCSMLF